MLFDQVRRLLERLIPLFGVGPQSGDILASFDRLCGESLALEPRRRAPEFSRINADGTPFQFSLSLDPHRAAPLQFIGEAGRPGCSMADRLRAGYACLRELGQSRAMAEEVERIVPMLRRLAPENDPALLADSSGAFWIALSFPPDDAPAITVYVNARWSDEAARWQRLGEFAELFDSAEPWRALAPLGAPALSPLGVAITVRPNRELSGRIYLRGFGVEVHVYRSLFLAATTPYGAEAFDGFTRYALAGDERHPTRSAVFSMELPAALTGAKFELCAHCAFADDAEAFQRIGRWLEWSGIGDEIYTSTVSSLTGRRAFSDARPSLHAYVGIAARGSRHSASVYLNPGAVLEFL